MAGMQTNKKSSKNPLKKIWLNIHGLPIEIITDHPLLAKMVVDEFKVFRANKNIKKNGVRLTVTSLPQHPGDPAYPARFFKYREISEPYTTPNTLVSRYGHSQIMVISHLKKRQIYAAVAPDPFLFPDPAYHICLTQPLSPWFKKRGLFFLHAGCVAENNEGVLIIGQSHTGKSVLTVSAVKAGFKYLSDEQPLLSLTAGTELQVRSFPRRIRLDRPVAAVFPELRKILKYSPLKRLAFHADDIWPDSFGLSCKPRLLIFPKFDFHRKLRLRRMSASSVLAKLINDDHFVWYQDGPWNKLSHNHMTVFEHLCKQTTAYELIYGNKDILEIPSLFRRVLHG